MPGGRGVQYPVSWEAWAGMRDQRADGGAGGQRYFKDGGWQGRLEEGGSRAEWRQPEQRTRQQGTRAAGSNAPPGCAQPLVPLFRRGKQPRQAGCCPGRRAAAPAGGLQPRQAECSPGRRAAAPAGRRAAAPAGGLVSLPCGGLVMAPRYPCLVMAPGRGPSGGEGPSRCHHRHLAEGGTGPDLP